MIRTIIKILLVGMIFTYIFHVEIRLEKDRPKLLGNRIFKYLNEIDKSYAAPPRCPAPPHKPWRDACGRCHAVHGAELWIPPVILDRSKVKYNDREYRFERCHVTNDLSYWLYKHQVQQKALVHIRRSDLKTLAWVVVEDTATLDSPKNCTKVADGGIFKTVPITDYF